MYNELLSTPFEKSQWFVGRKSFSSQKIQRITNLCTREEMEDATTYGNEEVTDDILKIRKTKVTFTDDRELYSIVDPIVNEINQALEWNYNITCIEPIQYTVYYGDGEKGHYHWHTDTIVNDSFLEDQSNNLMSGTTRKISMVIQLSDHRDYEGGEFELLSATTDPPEDQQELEYKLNNIGYLEFEPVPLKEFYRQGDVIIMPSYVYHRVKPVIKGIRRSLVCWFRGPKWT